jgi:hypothetical protein
VEATSEEAHDAHLGRPLPKGTPQKKTSDEMTALSAGVSRSSSSKELAGACIGTMKWKQATPRTAGHGRQRLEGGEKAMMLDDGEAQREAHEKHSDN